MRVNDPDSVERPVLGDSQKGYFGSDRIADVLRALDIPFVALNPGASFRGLHDSLVNHLGNEQPRMLLCLHEESAVAIAHGWAKVTEKLMAVVLHSNVGLMHGTMAIFNAWCDRVPILILGATGPMDAAKRRPWIEWLHTSRDQGSLVRGYTKWDDQPVSPAAATESLLRAYKIASTAPPGPVYVNLDVELQEKEAVDAPMPNVARYRPAAPPAPDPATLRAAAEALRNAKRPLILYGRVGRSQSAWDERVRLAERLGAAVLTDMKAAAAFPTSHPLHAAEPSMQVTAQAVEVLRQADVMLSVDWIDLAGSLSAAGTAPPTIINVSMDEVLHNGWSMDHQGLPAADHGLFCTPEAAVSGLLGLLGEHANAPWNSAKKPAEDPAVSGMISTGYLAKALRRAIGSAPSCLIRVPISWPARHWDLAGPFDALGHDGGGGIGSGPGMATGSALALRDSGRLPVAVLGDGDFLMGCTALWTAAHYNVPMLIIVANNRSFYNDELHQERVAKMRGRNPDNKWIGQQIFGPDIDVAGLARAQGCVGFGPVEDHARLNETLAEAVAATRGGNVVVVDVRIERGYGAEMAASILSGGKQPGQRDSS